MKRALARDRADDDAEARLLDRVLTLETGLRDESRRPGDIEDLKLLEQYREPGSGRGRVDERGDS